jgi:hypothetical protein
MIQGNRSRVDLRFAGNYSGPEVVYKGGLQNLYRRFDSASRLHTFTLGLANKGKTQD